MNKNTRTIATVLGVVAVMIALSFASVPFYRMFCQKTGFGGTTQRSSALPGVISERKVKILFDANVNEEIPWDFKPDKTSETIKLGQQGLISFLAKSDSPRTTIGTAIYNVSPPKVGQYFHKIQCFCFNEQTLTAYQEMHMPVVFYVDPKMADDPEMDDVKVITLAYTFYPAASKALDKAQEDFYNAP